MSRGNCRSNTQTGKMSDIPSQSPTCTVISVIASIWTFPKSIVNKDYWPCHVNVFPLLAYTWCIFINRPSAGAGGRCECWTTPTDICVWVSVVASIPSFPIRLPSRTPAYAEQSWRVIRLMRSLGSEPSAQRNKFGLIMPVTLENESYFI